MPRRREGQMKRAETRVSALKERMAATYSRGIYKTTTIGNAAFDGRVRNGIGSDHSFMATTKCVRTATAAFAANTFPCDVKEQSAPRGAATEWVRPFSENYTQGHSSHTTRELKSHFPLKEKSDQASRPISTSQLNTSRCLHFRPIKRVVCPWSLGSLRSGIQYLGMSLALRCFQRLSLPHMATQRCP